MKSVLAMEKRLFVFFFGLLLTGTMLAQITIQTDRNTANYEVGETIVFTVHSTMTGPAEYEIRYSERSKVLAQGKIDLVAGQDVEIPIEIQEPCFIICKVSLFGNEGFAGASISPFDIVPFEDTPVDFDAFWNGLKAQLAQIPMDPQVAFMFQTPASKTYRVNLANIDNRRVYGYISIPTTQGSFAAVLQVPAYGSFPGNASPIPFVAENLGMIAMSISIHNTEPDVQDPNAYEPNNPSVKEENYYRYALMGAVRAIDYIYARPDFDGSQLAVFGISQGGGLAISTAGLDSRVKLLIDLVPALCRHDGLKYARPSGHPHYIYTSRMQVGTSAYEQTITEATKYYDAVNFAKRFQGPSLSVFGYIDPTCPPATGFTANNQLLNAKMIVHSRDKGHDAYFAGQYDWYRFIRGYFSGLKPYQVPQENTAWYVLDAGQGQTVSVGANISLNATLTNKSQPITDLPIEWQKVSGPGGVHFSSPYAYQTDASFNQAGSYLLRAVVKDESPLAASGVWYDIVDYVWISVQ